MKLINTVKLAKNKDACNKQEVSIYDIAINDAKGKPITLSSYKGKKILFVNIASKCGFTKQLKDLQELNDTYSNRLIVIGLPCNQFAKQSPGEAKETQYFCEQNFGVTFLITENIQVKGDKQHPLYAWLTKKTLNAKKSSTVLWNFQKYLVGDNGKLVNYFRSTTNPMSLKITKYLDYN